MVDGLVFSTGIPTLDAKFKKGGIHVGDWVGLVGEPGSMKTLTCLKMAGEWLSARDGNCVIYITTETDEKSIITQFKEFGYDIDECIKAGTLAFVDAYSGGSGRACMTPENVTRKVIEIKRDFVDKIKSDYNSYIMLVIDSIAAFYESAPATCRTIIRLLSRGLKNLVDVCILTVQMSIGTEKAFGFGTEHGVDVIIRTGLYFNEYQKTWVQIAKTRGGNHDKHLFEYLVDDENNIMVGNAIPIKGRFKDISEAIESLKFSSSHEVQEERNAILRDLAKSVKEFLKDSKK
jgi:KaiC/GvpD/RAD55 family RecA-like ATPase